MIKGWLVWLVAGLVLGNLYPLMERYCRKWWVKGLLFLVVLTAFQAGMAYYAPGPQRVVVNGVLTLIAGGY